MLLLKNLFYKYEKEIKKVATWIDNKWKKITQIGNLVTIIYIFLLYNESKVQAFIGKTAEILKKVTLDEKAIEEKFSFFENLKYIFVGYLILEFFISIIKFLYNKCMFFYQKFKFRKDVLVNEDEKNNKLYINMYEYFSNEENTTPILVTGEWGCGKTTAINDFFEKYYKYRKQKVYRISCFGITTREVLVERIRNICEKEDESCLKHILDSFESIPVIGKALKNILIPTYDFNELAENSIFIFDNFERIETQLIERKRNGMITNKSTLNKNSIQEKYDIVTGTIDELIERYKMKAIIVADVTQMLTGYVYDNFICKLGCKRFEINSKFVTATEIWNEIISKDITIQNSYKQEFDNIFNQIAYLMIKLWEFSKCKNIRLLHKVIYNYIELIKYLLKNNYEFDVKNNEQVGIFITVLVINLKENANQAEPEIALEKLFELIKPRENVLSYIENRSYDERTKLLITILSTTNCLWYGNNSCNVVTSYWENVENNHNNIKLHLECQKALLESAEWIELTKFNYKSVMTQTNKMVLWKDVVYLLQIIENDVINYVIELIENDRVIYNNARDSNDEVLLKIQNKCNASYTIKLIEDKYMTPIFERNKKLANVLVDRIEQKLGGKLEEAIENPILRGTANYLKYIDSNK